MREKQVYCTAKDIGHKQYEYGNRVSVTGTAKRNLIVDMVCQEKNLHNGRTQPAVLGHIERSRSKAVNRAVVDWGSGKNEVNSVEIILPKNSLRKTTATSETKSGNNATDEPPSNPPVAT